jgi:hypothetical protein
MALMRLGGKRALVTLSVIALTVSLGVAIHGLNLMLQGVDSIATESQRFVEDIGVRLAAIGSAALTSSLAALLLLSAWSRDDHRPALVLHLFAGLMAIPLVLLGQFFAAAVLAIVVLMFAMPDPWRSLQMSSTAPRSIAIFLAIGALLAGVVGEVALTPPLYDLGPEMAAIEAFEPPREAVEFATFKEPSEHPEMSRTWMVRGSSDEVVELTRLSLERWADDGSVERASELPSAFRAKRNGEFALARVYENATVPGTAQLALRVKRGRFPEI